MAKDNLEITDDDKADLTDEERAALEDGDEVPDDDPNAEGNEPDGEKVEKNADEDEAEEEETDEEKEDAKKPEDADEDKAADSATATAEEAAAAEAAAKAEEEATAAAAAQQEKELTVEEVFGAAHVVNPPPELGSDKAERLAAIEAESAKLIKDLDDGEITVTEYHAKSSKLTSEATDIKMEIRDHERDVRDHKRELTRVWAQDCDKFLSLNPQYKDAAKFNALNAEVVRLAQPEVNTEKLNDRQIMLKAHATMTKLFGTPAEAKAATKEAKAAAEEKPAAKPVEAKKVAQVVVKQKELPPALHKMPVAEAAGADESKWAALDRLQRTDPERYEDRLMAMSPAERDEYERA